MAAKLRIGFVGAGFMGQLAHIRSYALLREECELVALAEPRQRTAQLVAERYGIARIYRDHRELLEAEQLDGIVASQRYTHHAALLPELYPHVRYVFTEKPLALSADTGDRLAALAREEGCVHMLGYQRRSDPATVEAKGTIDAWRASGELGRLRYLRMCFTDGDWTGNAHGLIDVGEQPPPFPAEGPPPEFAADEEALWALATGVDQLVHPLNLLRHFVGEPYRLVFAHATGRLYAFESESGVPMAIEVSPYRLSVGYDEELLVAFEHGYVRLCPAPSLAVNRAGRVEIYRDPGGMLPQRIAPELTWIDPQQAQAASFLRVCRGEVPPPTDATEAAVDLHLVADIVRTRVALPGARDALRADREERDRAWEERRQTIEGKR